jgi:ribosome biogenesis SPOUT family RNA methylase Rps3
LENKYADLESLVAELRIKTSEDFEAAKFIDLNKVIVEEGSTLQLNCAIDEISLLHAR